MDIFSTESSFDHRAMVPHGIARAGEARTEWKQYEESAGEGRGGRSLAGCCVVDDQTRESPPPGQQKEEVSFRFAFASLLTFVSIG
jgi:hypothetical protein